MSATATALTGKTGFQYYWTLTKLTFSDWFEDKALRLAAALALYTILSLAPLMVIAIKVVTIAIPHQIAGMSGDKYVSAQMEHLVGSQGGAAIGEMIKNSQTTGQGTIAAVVSAIILLLSASGVFGELQDSLNTIWEVKPKPNLPWWSMFRARFFSVAMVFIIAFLLIMSMVVTAAIGPIINKVIGQQTVVQTQSADAGKPKAAAETPGANAAGQSTPAPTKEQEKKDERSFFAKTVAYVIDFVVTLVVVTLLFAAIFRVLPDVRIAWRDVWIGAVVTGVLFKIGQIGLAIYLSFGSTTSAFGAAGSLVAVLLWAYYSSAILFLGAEFTQVYARAQGRKIVPSNHAVPVTEEERAQQGMPSPDNVLAAAEGLPPPVAPDSTSYPTQAKEPTYLYPPTPYAPLQHRPHLGRGTLLTLGGLAAGAAGAWYAANRRGVASQARLTTDAIGRRIGDIEKTVGSHAGLKRLGSDLHVQERIRQAERKLIEAQRAMKQRVRPTLTERLKDWLPT